ncbi:MAG: hypothetical protein Q9227_003834 [Pyrenula ochraceoflavens]
MRGLYLSALLGILFQFCYTQVPQDVGHLAPNSSSEDSELTTFIVKLYKWHSLELHFERIATNLSEKLGWQLLSDSNVYRVDLNSTFVQEFIRQDPGVQYVKRVSYPQLDLDVYSAPEYEESLLPDPHLASRWLTEVRKKSSWPLRMLAGWGRADLSENVAPAPFLGGSGEGVNVYILDTGIRRSHNLFKEGAPVVNFNDAQDSDTSPYVDESFEDNASGHGTHVAGIVRQIAPGARLVNVKVLALPKKKLKSETTQAVRDIVKEHNAFKKNPPYPGWKGSVINLSFTYSLSDDDDDADQSQDIESDPFMDPVLKSAYEAGIPIVVAAGNKHELPGYPCGTDKSYSIKTGTSQSAPFVAGILATFIGFEAITSNTAKAQKRLLENAQFGVIDGLRENTPNGLANTGLNRPDFAANFPYLGAPAAPLAKENDPFPRTTQGVLAFSITTLSARSFPTPDPGTASVESMPVALVIESTMSS